LGDNDDDDNLLVIVVPILGLVAFLAVAVAVAFAAFIRWACRQMHDGRQLM
jgi:hypothetical protein